MLGIDNFERVAKLAKLNIAADRAAAFEADIQEIVSMVQQLQEVDTEGVQPTYFGNALENIYRPDQAKLSAKREAFLANTPESQDGFIKVPAILESGEE